MGIFSSALTSRPRSGRQVGAIWGAVLPICNFLPDLERNQKDGTQYGVRPGCPPFHDRGWGAQPSSTIFYVPNCRFHRPVPFRRTGRCFIRYLRTSAFGNDVKEHREKLQHGAAQHKEVPDRVIERDPFPEVKDHAERIDDAARGKQAEPCFGKCGNERLGDKHHAPTQQQIDEAVKPFGALQEHGLQDDADNGNRPDGRTKECAGRAFFMKGEREPGRTRAYRRPRYMFIVPSVATSARLTCRNQYGTRTRIHDSLVGEFDGVLFNCLLKVPDNFLHTVSMQSVSFPWAV